MTLKIPNAIEFFFSWACTRTIHFSRYILYRIFITSFLLSLKSLFHTLFACDSISVIFSCPFFSLPVQFMRVLRGELNYTSRRANHRGLRERGNATGPKDRISKGFLSRKSQIERGETPVEKWRIKPVIVKQPLPNSAMDKKERSDIIISFTNAKERRVDYTNVTQSVHLKERSPFQMYLRESEQE